MIENKQDGKSPECGVHKSQKGPAISESETGFSYSASDGKLDTIRGESVPRGMIAALGIEHICAAGRKISARAIQMTVGLFQFAERSNRKEPNGEMKVNELIGSNIHEVWRQAAQITNVAEKITEIIKPEFGEIKPDHIPRVLELVCLNICKEFGIDSMEISLDKLKKSLEKTRQANQRLIDENRAKTKNNR